MKLRKEHIESLIEEIKLGHTLNADLVASTLSKLTQILKQEKNISYIKVPKKKGSNVGINCLGINCLAGRLVGKLLFRVNYFLVDE